VTVPRFDALTRLCGLMCISFSITPGALGFACPRSFPRATAPDPCPIVASDTRAPMQRGGASVDPDVARQRSDVVRAPSAAAPLPVAPPDRSRPRPATRPAERLELARSATSRVPGCEKPQGGRSTLLTSLLWSEIPYDCYHTTIMVGSRTEERLVEGCSVSPSALFCGWPGAADNSPTRGLIGVLDVGGGGSLVQVSTWAAVRALYRRCGTIGPPGHAVHGRRTTRRSAMDRLILCLVVLLALVHAASATTYEVSPNGQGDFPTIAAAISAAVNGDIIELTDGVFTGGGNNNLSYGGKSITIRSASGVPQSCSIDGTGCMWTRAFNFTSGEGPSSVLEGITIRHFRLDWDMERPVDYDVVGGGIRCVGSSPTITNCIFYHNDVSSYMADASLGGAMYCTGGSSPTLTNCVFVSNYAIAFNGVMYGGALYFSDGGSPRIIQCTFEDNQTWMGAGAIYCSGVSPTITDCSFTNNDGATNGAVYVGGPSATIADCNFGDTFGYSLVVRNTSAVTVMDCSFASGNALHCDGGSPTIIGCTFTRAWLILECTQASPAVLNCTFAHNEGWAQFGGIYLAQQSSPTFANSIIAFTEEGPAVYCDGTSGATLTCCDVFDNDGGDWTGCLDGQGGWDGNFSADPLFCMTQNPGEPYTLSSNSPCAPGNSPGCGLIGAWGVGCEAMVAVKETSWGSIKAMYR
jgi:hypothetical protein